ncbi:DUF2155 domain-containing protein [Roseomonas sp. NAR14]|uniref:DUF2155 domain-containing protein n=1 Tax=Roseomonas acroporae TaxID=2937791 RepID=A0A9X1Y869_9PROT|nr:DUF2155 domain-containing protein [Roseomonas acroporae]MCK8783887.1 DUF2155 domain-containing protein [Roseomonas acroporae]
MAALLLAAAAGVAVGGAPGALAQWTVPRADPPAAEPAPSVPEEDDLDATWVRREVAQLQALDKVTARISVFQARVGQPARFGALTILVRACDARPPDEVPDAAAWMEITDSQAPPGRPPAFRGWMFANAPGVNMLEHPVYDIRVLECR